MDHLDDKRRFESLDALRAVACFLVIWQHVSESLCSLSSGGSWTSEAADYFDFGRIGVVAFFCISGFVIPSSLRGDRRAAIRSFSINRFYRLFPPYWFSIALAIPVFFVFSRATLDFDRALANLGMVAVFFEQPHLLGHFWTLEIELAFYIASAILYLVFGNRKVLFSIVGFILSYNLWQKNLLGASYGALPMLGMFLSIMFASAMARTVYDIETGKRPVQLKYLKQAIRIGLAIMIYLLVEPLISGIVRSFTEENPFWNRWGWGHFLGIVLFIAFFLFGKSPRWLSSAGRWTYSAYLLHSIVFTLIARAWVKFSIPHIRLELFIILTTLISFAVAYLAFRYIESPFIRTGKKLANKIVKQPGNYSAYPN